MQPDISICICIYALNFNAGIFDRMGILLWVGQRSYVFYLCHMLFLGRAKNIIQPYLGDVQIAYIPVLMIITIFSVSLCVYSAERLLPATFYPHMLGLKKSK